MKKLILLSIILIVGCAKQESKTIQESETFSVISRKYPNSGKIQSINTYEVINQTDVIDSLIIDYDYQANKFYNEIKTLDSNSRVLLSMDMSIISMPEVFMSVSTLIKQLKNQNIPFYIISLWSNGNQLAEEIINDIIIAGFPLKRYEDFVNLPFKAGNEAIIRVISSIGLKKLYDKDIIGKPTNSIMLMNGINGLSDFDLIINISEGYPGIQEWVQYTVDNNELPIIGIIPTNQSENVVSLLKGISRYGGNRKKLNSVIVGYLGARIYQKLVVNKIGEDLANIPVGINDYVYLKEFYSLDESGRITTYHQYFQYGALEIYTGIIGNKINYNKWSPSRVLLENKEYEINNYIWPDIPTKFIGK